MLFVTERKMMAIIGRPREFDRGAALEAAMLAFWRKGFAATSMNDLCEAMDVRSPSLYAAFGGKEALYREALQRYVETVGPPVWGKLAEGATARASVEKLLLAATESLPQSHGLARRLHGDARRRLRRMASRDRRRRQEDPA